MKGGDDAFFMIRDDLEESEASDCPIGRFEYSMDELRVSGECRLVSYPSAGPALRRRRRKDERESNGSACQSRLCSIVSINRFRWFRQLFNRAQSFLAFD